MRLTGHRSTEETLIKFAPYPRTHARRGFGEDRIMVRMDIEDLESVSLLLMLSPPENHR